MYKLRKVPSAPSPAQRSLPQTPRQASQEPSGALSKPPAAGGSHTAGRSVEAPRQRLGRGPPRDGWRAPEMPPVRMALASGRGRRVARGVRGDLIPSATEKCRGARPRPICLVRTPCLTASDTYRGSPTGRRTAHSGLIGNYIATDQLSTPVPVERTLLAHIASLTGASRRTWQS